MKKLLITALSLSLVFLSCLVVFGFQEEDKYNFSLKLNEEYLNLVNSKSSELSKGNNEKFGGDISKSSIDVQLFDLEETVKEEKNIEYSSGFKGVIKTLNGNFAFEGAGYLNKFTISEDREIYTGNYEGKIKNKKGTDTLTLSLRFDPETEETDIVVVSGVMGDTGILPFGQPFLFDKELNEINALAEKN